MDRPGHACVYSGIIYALAVGIRAEQCTLRFAESFVSFAENFVNLAGKSGILTVSNRHNCKFSQNALNGDDVENRFPVIELV